MLSVLSYYSSMIRVFNLNLTYYYKSEYYNTLYYDKSQHYDTSYYDKR